MKNRMKLKLFIISALKSILSYIFNCVCASAHPCTLRSKHENLFMWMQCSCWPEEGIRFPSRWSYRWLRAFGYGCWTLNLGLLQQQYCTLNYWIIFPSPYIHMLVFLKISLQYYFYLISFLFLYISPLRIQCKYFTNRAELWVGPSVGDSISCLVDIRVKTVHIPRRR